MHNLKYLLFSLIGRLSHSFEKGFVCVSLSLIYSHVILRVLSWTLTTDVSLIYTPLSRCRSTTAITWFVDIIRILLYMLIYDKTKYIDRTCNPNKGNMYN